MQENARPPRDNIVRAAFPGFELRAEGDSGMPTLTGHFAVFNQWTEINSIFEGRFLERFSPGAFKKTFKESRSRMKVLFQHGMDPQVGDKPLGPIRELREDGEGGYYEVPLLDTSYVRDLIPGLEAGLYGASFRFSVVLEERNENPEPSDHNPLGLPERTVKEARVAEFGPVTFPAYQEASAGLRSVTDEYILEQFARHPDRLRQLVEARVPLLTRQEEQDTPAPPEPDVEVEEGRDIDVPETEEAAAHDAPPTEPEAEPQATDEGRAIPTHIYGVKPKEGRPAWRI